MPDRTQLSRNVQYLAARRHEVALYLLATLIVEMDLEELEELEEHARELSKAVDRAFEVPTGAYLVLMEERYGK